MKYLGRSCIIVTACQKLVGSFTLQQIFKYSVGDGVEVLRVLSCGAGGAAACPVAYNRHSPLCYKHNTFNNTYFLKFFMSIWLRIFIYFNYGLPNYLTLPTLSQTKHIECLICFEDFNSSGYLHDQYLSMNIYIFLPYTPHIFTNKTLWMPHIFNFFLSEYHYIRIYLGI